MPRVLSMIRFFGPPSIFFTLSPADVDSLLMLRMTTFGSTPYDASMPLPTLSERARLAAANPVMAAYVYRRMLDCLLEILFGLAPMHTRQRNVPMHARPIGVFGRPVAYVVVSEEQQRRSLHAHGIFWGDMSPTLFAKAIDDAVLRGRLCARLDRIVRACLPVCEEKQHSSTLPCNEPTKLHRDGRNVAPTPGVDIAGYTDFVCSAVNSTNVHSSKHSFTCHKGSIGRYKCRLAYPRGPFSHGTAMLCLVLMPDAVTGVFKARALVDIPARDAADVAAAAADPLLEWQDGRCVVVELERADIATPPQPSAGGAWCDIAADNSS